MPGQQDIVDAIRKGLDDIHFLEFRGWANWTTEVYTKLVELGHKLGCQAGASWNKVKPGTKPDYGEWLAHITGEDRPTGIFSDLVAHPRGPIPSRPTS